MLDFVFAVEGIRQILHPFNGEGRIGDGAHGNAHELHGIVIGSHPVGAEIAAAFAAVDDGPFALVAHPNGHGLHDTAAVAFSVAGLDVHVEAVKAVRAVIAVVAAGAFRHHQTAAELALEAVGAGVGLVVTLFKGLALMFSVHDGPPKDFLTL